jgi:uncharacterized sulfatase
MSRRAFLRTSALAGAAGAGFALFDGTLPVGAVDDTSGSGPERPNIVFLLVDELRFPSVFPEGVNTPAEFLNKFMPNTFALWQQGVKFENLFTAGTACTPSRAALATGLYPHQEWEVATRTSAGPSLRPAFPTYGKLLRKVGYHTPYIGKWHLSNPPSGSQPASSYLENYGFDGMTIPDPTGTNGQGLADDPNIATQAVNWLQGRASSEQPFCLTVSFVNPHDKQYFWAGTEGTFYEELFQQSELIPLIKTYTNMGEQTVPSYGYPTLPPNWETPDQLARNKPSTHTLFRTFQELVWGGAATKSTVTDFAVEPSPILPVEQLGLGIAPFRYWQRGLDVYTFVMQAVDKEIGRVVAAVPEKLRDNTVFVLTSDHGEYGGAHGLLSGKLGTLYDEAWHVPLIVVDRRGRFVDQVDTPRQQLVSTVDLAPMLVTLGNGGSRAWMTGDLAQLYGERLDVMPLLASPNAAGRDHVLFSTDELVPDTMNYLRAPTHVFGVRTADAKLGTYSHWLPGTTRPVRETMELEFYDYSTPDGRAETVSTPQSPQAAKLLALLFNQYLPQQMEAPLPVKLRAPQFIARESYLAYVALANAYFARQLVGQGLITSVLGYGMTG